MVYDTSGYLVGDTHWRHDMALQDGDELELEKGIMVQVGELVERSKTDLGRLFDKRSPGTQDSVAKNAASQQSVLSRSGSTSRATGKVKSLSEVLGRTRNTQTNTRIPTPSYSARAKSSAITQQPNLGIERETTARKGNEVASRELADESSNIAGHGASSQIHRGSGAQERSASRSLGSSSHQQTSGPRRKVAQGQALQNDFAHGRATKDISSQSTTAAEISERFAATTALRDTVNEKAKERMGSTTAGLNKVSASRTRQILSETSNTPSKAPFSTTDSTAKEIDSENQLHPPEKRPMGSLLMPSDKPRKKLMFMDIMSTTARNSPKPGRDGSSQPDLSRGFQAASQLSLVETTRDRSAKKLRKQRDDTPSASILNFFGQSSQVEKTAEIQEAAAQQTGVIEIDDRDTPASLAPESQGGIGAQKEHGPMHSHALHPCDDEGQELQEVSGGVSPVREDADADASGPWSIEASIFFDWWPPGREVPKNIDRLR
ncbi:hypothetical protein KEM55_005534 [Ascosphaera atra]|nr:hypothetical protein KEM55_005534 [Ascosphaera atra]